MKLIKTEEAVGHVLCHDLTQIIKGQYKDARFRKGHVVQPEDTLWDIAKKYYTTSEHIRNMNHLTEEIRAGQKLLIVKSAVLHTAS